jgi:hypothetical protein
MSSEIVLLSESVSHSVNPPAMSASASELLALNGTVRAHQRIRDHGNVDLIDHGKTSGKFARQMSGLRNVQLNVVRNLMNLTESQGKLSTMIDLTRPLNPSLFAKEPQNLSKSLCKRHLSRRQSSFLAKSKVMK